MSNSLASRLGNSIRSDVTRRVTVVGIYVAAILDQAQSQRLTTIRMRIETSICILIIAVTAMAFPQTSFYAGNRKQSYPQVLSRFGGGDDTNVDNRFGDTNTASTNTPVTEESFRDPEIVNRVASWPKERQPFWYINSQHIDSQREQKVPCKGCNSQQPVPQSPSRTQN
ncbi:uncharacterized protein [Periplaneta americana]|uniref:uncharacterized protein n=1 Tax=Periplaneta americana TaxID=6978 RepID=UPI0037E98FF6